MCGCAHQPRTPAVSEELEWLIGVWELRDGETHNIERWHRRQDGTLVGTNETRSSDSKVRIERMEIAQTGDGTIYRARPPGQPAHDFLRRSGGVDWVRFESPHHDWPQTITYRRDGEYLEAVVAGSTSNGPRVATWRWTLKR